MPVESFVSLMPQVSSFVNEILRKFKMGEKGSGIYPDRIRLPTFSFQPALSRIAAKFLKTP